MAENCLMSLEPWAFGRPESSLWSLTESFTRDNDALTRALQISLSQTHSPSGSPPPPDTHSQSHGSSLPKPEPATRNPLPCSPSGRVTKRKSRASKKSPTTYITADPANFRQMVQQVTGARFGLEPGAPLPVESLVRPEPRRVGFGSLGEFVQGPSCLPTLDTSAGLLDRARMVTPELGSVGPVVGQGVGSGFDFGGFSSFPTLESWSAM